jgi:hypothetical protein
MLTHVINYVNGRLVGVERYHIELGGNKNMRQRIIFLSSFPKALVTLIRIRSFSAFMLRKSKISLTSTKY